MNINPISFGKTYYVPNRMHGCDIKNLEINIKTLLGINTPIDVIKNSDGDIFVLTNEESNAYRKITQDDKEKMQKLNKEQLMQHGVTYWGPRNNDVDKLIGATYDFDELTYAGEAVHEGRCGLCAFDFKV